MIADPVPIVEVEGDVLPTPTAWSMSLDMLQPADTFNFSGPMFIEPDRIPTDAEIRLRFGSRVVFSGRIERPSYSDADQWNVQAQDGVRRLVSESLPGAGRRIGRASLSSEIRKIVYPWFPEVRFDNASDRTLRRGTARGLAGTAREPLSASENRAIDRVLDAGIKRWEALQKLLVPLRLLAFSSADGKALIVTRPNYDQEIQYWFRKTPQGSNVIRMSYARSVAERHQEIVVSGSKRSKGPFTAQRLSTPGRKKIQYVARHSLGVARDESGDFRAQKRLFVVDTSLYPKDAQAQAERLMGQQRARAEEIEITVPGLGQRAPDGRAYVLYAPDTMCSVLLQTAVDSNADSPRTLVNAAYYITRVDYQSDGRGSSTRLSVVPKGTVLV